MSLLDKASLILTPNAYKASKLYSVVPNTTLGDMDVVRATTATRVNSAGLIESVAINIPRIDYSNGSCPSLLVEPQRTNLLTYSDQFDDTSYGKIGVTISVNSSISPSGLLVADKLVEDTSTGLHVFLKNITVVAGQEYTLSIYVKASERNKFALNVYDNTFINAYGADFNIITGTVIFKTSQGLGTLLSSSIKNVGNDWYLCSVTGVLPTFSNLSISFFLNDNSGSASYTGNGTSGLFIWGAQLEAGSYATSYIPSVATSVTRNADVISKTGISSLIGQTEGTVFAESFVKLGQASMAFWIRKLSGGFYGDFLNLIVNSSGVAVYEGNNAGNNVCYIFNGVQLTEGYHKFAIIYKTNYFALFIDGLKIGEDLIGVPPSCDELYIDQYIDGGISNVPKKSVQLFKTALTDAECIELTTL